MGIDGVVSGLQNLRYYHTCMHIIKDSNSLTDLNYSYNQTKCIHTVDKIHPGTKGWSSLI